MSTVWISDLDPRDDGERTDLDDGILDEDDLDEEQDDDDLFGEPPGSNPSDPHDDDW